MLLPSGTKSTSPDANIDAKQAVTLASAAVSDARGFCDRQPDACVAGGKVAVALGHKAEAGARTIYEFITTKLTEKSAPEKTAAKVDTVYRARPRHADPGRHAAGLACAGSAAAAPRGAHRPAGRLNYAHKSAFSRGPGTPAAIFFGHRRSRALYIGGMTTIDEIVENFTLLDQWDDRYRYVIELGRTLPPLPESAHTEANKVRGCASQVWLLTHVKPDGAAGPTLTFDGDSDAHIVRGLIAILLALYSGKRAQEILETDALDAVRPHRLAREPHAATLERPALDGRAHPRRSQSRAGAGLTSGVIATMIFE